MTGHVVTYIFMGTTVILLNKAVFNKAQEYLRHLLCFHSDHLLLLFRIKTKSNLKSLFRL